MSYNERYKTIRIELPIYEEIKQEKENTGIIISKLLEKAWELYKQGKEEAESEAV